MSTADTGDKNAAETDAGTTVEYRAYGAESPATGSALARFDGPSALGKRKCLELLTTPVSKHVALPSTSCAHAHAHVRKDWNGAAMEPKGIRGCNVSGRSSSNELHAGLNGIIDSRAGSAASARSPSSANQDVLQPPIFRHFARHRQSVVGTSRPPGMNCSAHSRLCTMTAGMTRILNLSLCRLTYFHLSLRHTSFCF